MIGIVPPTQLPFPLKMSEVVTQANMQQNLWNNILGGEYFQQHITEINYTLSTLQLFNSIL